MKTKPKRTSCSTWSDCRPAVKRPNRPGSKRPRPLDTIAYFSMPFFLSAPKKKTNRKTGRDYNHVGNCGVIASHLSSYISSFLIHCVNSFNDEPSHHQGLLSEKVAIVVELFFDMGGLAPKNAHAHGHFPSHKIFPLLTAVVSQEYQREKYLYIYNNKSFFFLFFLFFFFRGLLV